jgi:hypothetical protein
MCVDIVLSYVFTIDGHASDDHSPKVNEVGDNHRQEMMIVVLVLGSTSCCIAWLATH